MLIILLLFGDELDFPRTIKDQGTPCSPSRIFLDIRADDGELVSRMGHNGAETIRTIPI